MRNVYIINPKAGKHDHTVQFMERIRAVHATHGEEPEIYLTQRAGHGEELARAAAEKGERCAFGPSVATARCWRSCAARSFTKTPPWAYTRAAAATTSCAHSASAKCF